MKYNRYELVGDEELCLARPRYLTSTLRRILGSELSNLLSWSLADNREGHAQSLVDYGAIGRWHQLIQHLGWSLFPAEWDEDQLAWATVLAEHELGLVRGVVNGGSKLVRSANGDLLVRSLPRVTGSGFETSADFQKVWHDVSSPNAGVFLSEPSDGALPEVEVPSGSLLTEETNEDKATSKAASKARKLTAKSVREAIKVKATLLNGGNATSKAAPTRRAA